MLKTQYNLVRKAISTNDKEKKKKKKTEKEMFYNKSNTHKMPNGKVMSGKNHTKNSKEVKLGSKKKK